MTKKEIVNNLAQDIGYDIHVGLRKWTEHKRSMDAWRAIAEMSDDGAWEDLCKLVAEDIYPKMRKAFVEQLKEKK